MFNKIALIVATLAATACGSSNQTSQAKGSVNNGPIGPTPTLVRCAEVGGDGKFAIINFNSTSLMGGLTSPNVTFRCTKARAPRRPIPDANTALYSCQETRGGEGLISVNVFRQGNSGVVMANVFQDSFLGTEAPALIKTMICQ